MSVEGLVAFGIALLFLNRVRSAIKTASTPGDKSRPATESNPELRASPSGDGFSLQQVLREIQRLKQEAEQGRQVAQQPKPSRISTPSPPLQTPLRQGRMAAKAGTPSAARTGRMAAAAQVSRRLPMSASDPDRGPLGRISRTSLPSAEGSLEGESLEGAGQDEQGEALVQRRIYEAEHRTREGREASYQAQEQKVLKVEADRVISVKASTDRLRRAIVWREILGAPVGLRGSWHIED